MRVDESVDFQPYGAQFAALLSATLLTRCTASTDTRQALSGAACWGVMLFVCWAIRAPLRARRWATITPQWVGEAIAALGMLVFLATLFSDGVMPALGAMLLALTGAALVIAQRRAHLLLIVATCLTQVLMAAAESRSGWFVPCAAAFTFAVLSLFAFDLGESLRSQAAAVRLDARRASRGGALAAVLVMALALPLYLYVPQPPALLLGGHVARSGQDYSDSRVPPGGRARPTDGERAADGDPEFARDAPQPGRVNGATSGDQQTPKPDADTGATAPSKDDIALGSIRRDARIANAIVMYVKTSQPLYLRRKVLDRFVGDRWQRTSSVAAAVALQQGYLRPAARSGDASVTQQVDVVADLGDAGLPASAGVLQIRFPGDVLYDNRDGTFAAPQPLRADTSYTVDAAPQLLGSRYAEAAPPPDARFLQIDPALSSRVRELAERVSASADDPLHKALALEAHLRSEYAYSYETIVPYQGRTPIDWFLFDSRKGHCEFFASAMVVMLREIGIPARLANGFSLGEINPLTGFHEVRVLDGHAWAEAWIAGAGWVMFEPTPFYPLPHNDDKAPQQVASAADNYLERMADTSAQLSPQSLRTALLRAARDSWDTLRHLQRQLVRWTMGMLPWLPLWVVLCAATWAVALLVRAAWRDARERVAVARSLDAARSGSADAAAALAAAMEIALGARGVPRAAQRTWREYCRELSAHAVPLPHNFDDSFDAARYGDGAADFAAHVSVVGDMIHARIAAQRYPRLHQQWRRWMEWLSRRRSPVK